MDRIEPISQVISSFVRVNPVSATEYESRTINYIDKGGKISIEIQVDVYNRYGAINSVRIGHPTTIDTMA